MSAITAKTIHHSSKPPEANTASKNLEEQNSNVPPTRLLKFALSSPWRRSHSARTVFKKEVLKFDGFSDGHIPW